MLSLILTLGTTASAPLAARILRAHPRVEVFTDALLQVLIAGILLLDVIPQGLEQAGIFALVALGLGGFIGFATHRGERSLVGLAFFGLVIHGLTDGAALATTGPASEGLDVAVVLHTLPVALAVWRIAMELRSALYGWIVLALTGAATIAGFAATGTLLEGASPPILAVAECALAGILLHVLSHLSPTREPRIAGVGALTGAVLVIAQSWLAGEPLWEGIFFSLLADAAPALFISFLAAGLLNVFASYSLARMLSGGALVSVRISTLLVSVPLLGLPMTLLRFTGSIATAMAVGLLVGGRVEANTAGTTQPTAETTHTIVEVHRGRETLGERLRKGLVFGLVEAVDHTAAWVVMGLVAASWVAPVLAGHWLAWLPSGVQVFAAALIGIPMYVCASGATPLVAALMTNGVTPGAALAFLLTGPATDLATLGILRQMHGTRVAAGVGLTVFGFAVFFGLCVDAWWPMLGATVPAGHREHGFADLVSVLLLALLFGAALFRLGPRGFLEPLLHPLHDPSGHDSELAQFPEIVTSPPMKSISSTKA